MTNEEILNKLLEVYQKEIIKAQTYIWENNEITAYKNGYLDALDLALNEIHAMMTVIEEKLNIQLTHYY